MVLGMLKGVGDIIGGHSIAVFIRGIDELTDPMGKAEKAMKKFENQSKKTEKSTEKNKENVDQLKTKFSKLQLGMFAVGAAVAIATVEFYKLALETEKNQIVSERLGKKWEELKTNAITPLANELTNYLLLLDKVTKKEKENAEQSETSSETIGDLLSRVTMGTPVFGLLINSLVDAATATEQEQLKTELATKEHEKYLDSIEEQLPTQMRLDRTIEKLGNTTDTAKSKIKSIIESGLEPLKKAAEAAKDAVSGLKEKISGVLGVKTKDELKLEKDKIPLMRQRNELDQKIQDAKNKGLKDDSSMIENLEKQKEKIDGQINSLDLKLEYEQYNREEAELANEELNTANNGLRIMIDEYGGIEKAVIALNEKLNNELQIERDITKEVVFRRTLEMTKAGITPTESNKSKLAKATYAPQATVIIPEGSEAEILDPYESRSARNKRLGITEKKDFISRPGQEAVSFSPTDTIIGVKDPAKLMGGGGTNINIVVQGSIIKQGDLVNEVSKAIQRELMAYVRY